MVASFAILAIALQGPKTLEINPSADAWVYGHAPTPGLATQMRVWGSGSDSIEKPVPPTGECSYAFLSFALPNTNSERVKVTEAKLVVYFSKHEELTAEMMKSFPLEARGLDLNFTDKEFFVDTLKTGPDATIFGKAEIAEAAGTDKYKMTINLLGKDSAFGEWFQRGLGKKQLGIALTSTISPGDSNGAIYRIFSKEGAKDLQPRLIVKYTEGS